jgi:hypothetical protein
MAASLRDAAVVGISKTTRDRFSDSDNAQHTSEEAALSKFMTAVEDRDYREFVLVSTAVIVFISFHFIE